MGAFEIPDVAVEYDESREEKYARGAEYLGRYAGAFVSQLPSAMSRFVRFEVGRARVVPFVERSISSFVHDHLARIGMLGEFAENRPEAVRCAHPLVTLIEKLDALARRYGRDVMEADGFVRHYEDAARIVLAMERLPECEVSGRQLVEEMLAEKDIVAMPRADDPSLVLDDPAKRGAVERAYVRISPMFWGQRIPLDEACGVLREWVSGLRG